MYIMLTFLIYQHTVSDIYPDISGGMWALGWDESSINHDRSRHPHLAPKKSCIEKRQPFFVGFKSVTSLAKPYILKILIHLAVPSIVSSESWCQCHANTTAVTHVGVQSWIVVVNLEHVVTGSVANWNTWSLGWDTWLLKSRLLPRKNQNSFQTSMATNQNLSRSRYPHHLAGPNPHPPRPMAICWSDIPSTYAHSWWSPGNCNCSILPKLPVLPCLVVREIVGSGRLRRAFVEDHVVHVLGRSSGQDRSELGHVMFFGGVATTWKDLIQVKDAAKVRISSITFA